MILRTGDAASFYGSTIAEGGLARHRIVEVVVVVGRLLSQWYGHGEGDWHRSYQAHNDKARDGVFVSTSDGE